MTSFPHASDSTKKLNPHIFQSLGNNPEPLGLTTAVPKGNIKRAKVPNKTESEFGLMLAARKRAGEFDKVTFEGATLRLADRLRYTPDWMCESPTHPISQLRAVTFFEVKGSWIDGDSIPKFKMAREQHKWADFQMWQREKGRWKRLF